MIAPRSKLLFWVAVVVLPHYVRITRAATCCTRRSTSLGWLNKLGGMFTLGATKGAKFWSFCSVFIPALIICIIIGYVFTSSPSNHNGAGSSSGRNPYPTPSNPSGPGFNFVGALVSFPIFVVLLLVLQYCA